MSDDPPRSPDAPESGPPEAAAAIDMIAVVQQFTRFIPFNHYLGMEMLDVEAGLCRMRLPFRPEHIGDPTRPALHGGVIATVVDACGGAAIWTLLKPTERVSTIDLRVDYLRPGRPETLVIEGRVTRRGRHVAVASVRCWHPDKPDSTIAEGKGVYSVRDVGRNPPVSPARSET